MNPFFSVVIPLYNKEEFILNTIKSVLNQTFQDFEIIIVNDGSTDGSFNIVKQIKDDRIRLFSNKNRGLSFSRNYGIKKAKADFIAFLDADDLWMEDFLKSIFELTSIYKNSYVFASNHNFFFKNEKPILTYNELKNNEYTLVTNYFERQKNIYASSSLVCHKLIFDKVGFFNESITYGEEEDFAIRCFSKYQLAYCNTVKVYRLDGIENQLTAPNKNSKRIIPNYDMYLKDDYSNINLKKYIDFVHYKLVVLFKMEKNYGLVKFYKAKINVSNLNLIQRLKFYLPITFFYNTKTIYIWFAKRFIHF
jgi:glycosyltransferase involved in cell wall biosynthesis